MNSIYCLLFKVHHSGCFQMLDVINNIVLTEGCIYIFELVFWVSPDKFSEVELLDHKTVAVLIFWENSTIFYSDCTSPNPHQQCTWVPFSPHPRQHLFVDLLMIVILTGVRWYIMVLFAFLWWLVTLDIFSHIYWASIYPLWRNVYSGPLHTF